MNLLLLIEKKTIIEESGNTICAR